MLRSSLVLVSCLAVMSLCAADEKLGEAKVEPAEVVRTVGLASNASAVAPRLNRNGQEEQNQHGGLTPNRSPERDHTWNS